MRSIPFTIGVLSITLGVGWARTTDSRPRFEVASVKPSPLGQSGGQGGRENIVANPGNLIMRHVRLRSCIRWAYDIKEYQILGPDWLGSPGWLGSDIARYEISAKAADGVPVSKLRLMLQTLLADRFRLVVHRDTKDVPSYRLIVVKKGPQLHVVGDSDGESSASAKGAVLSMQKTSMSEFAAWLSGPMAAPVLDMTNLQGRFDLSIDDTPYMSPGGTREDAQYAFVKAIQEQLGLKLERGLSPIEMLIVDRVEKTPTGN